MKVTIPHTLDCTPETFWRRIFFDREYNEKLFKGELRFPAYDLVRLDEQPDRVERHVKVTPPQSAPEVVRKLVKGTFSYEELGTWTAAEGVYRFRTVSSVMTEKVRIDGIIRAAPSGAGKMVRTAEIDVVVSVLLVGGMVEKFLADQMRASYDCAAVFTNKWIAERKLQG
jgi:hypothetical protein